METKSIMTGAVVATTRGLLQHRDQKEAANKRLHPHPPSVRCRGPIIAPPPTPKQQEKNTARRQRSKLRRDLNAAKITTRPLTPLTR